MTCLPHDTEKIILKSLNPIFEIFIKVAFKLPLLKQNFKS